MYIDLISFGLGVLVMIIINILMMLARRGMFDIWPPEEVKRENQNR